MRVACGQCTKPIVITRTGLCKACRTIPCLTCGSDFVRKDLSETKCQKCATLIRRRVSV